MKIRSVVANNRKKAFEVTTPRGASEFPYDRADPAPSSEDPVTHAFVDPELGREGFTYELRSGAEGSVHVDHVLEVAEDPAYMADMLLYQLSVDASAQIERTGASTRQLARRLGTSPSQLYRLLDPTNTRKSVRQMLELLHLLGCRVDVTVRPAGR